MLSCAARRCIGVQAAAVLLHVRGAEAAMGPHHHHHPQCHLRFFTAPTSTYFAKHSKSKRTTSTKVRTAAAAGLPSSLLVTAASPTAKPRRVSKSAKEASTPPTSPKAASTKCASTTLPSATSATAPGAGTPTVPVLVTDPGPSHAGRLQFDTSKAGLQQVDKAYVQRVIDRASKGSAFYENERRRGAERQERNKTVLAKAAQFHALPAAEKAALEAKVAAYEAELEATRDLTQCFVHVDMDMFYAAVAAKQDPSLHEIPFAVGSFTMLATSNYVARRFGVRSGMPGFIAKRLCPQLRIVPLDFDAYRREATIVREVGKRYDPNFVSVGLDELTMNVTRYLRRHPQLTPSQVCEQFRRDVLRATRLTCSGGIAPTAALAKIASNEKKPNGQHEIVLHTREEVIEFVGKLPIRQVPGIGSAQESMLNALGVHTCSDLLSHKTLLCYLFKEKTFLFYLSIGLGLVHTHVDRTLAECTRAADRKRKSISKSATFTRRLRSEEQLRKAVVQMAVGAHEVLLHDSMLAQSITLFITTHDFHSQSFRTTLLRPTNNFRVLLSVVKELAEPHAKDFASIRLVGVGFAKLTSSQAKSKQSSASSRTARSAPVRASARPSTATAQRQPSSSSTTASLHGGRKGGKAVPVQQRSARRKTRAVASS